MMHFYSQFSFRITNGCEFANSGCKYFFLIRKFGRIRYSHLLYAFTFYLLPFTLLSQSVGIFGSKNLGVNNTGAHGNASSVFDISSTTGGILIPRVTNCQRTTAGCAGGMLDISGNLPAAAQGLLVYQTDATEGFYYNTSTTTIPSWILISAGSGPWTKSGGNVYLTNPTDKVGIGITSAGTKLWMQADAECVAVSYVASDVTGPMGFGSLRARGTLAAPSPVQAGDQLGAFSFSGYDGVALGTPTAAITASATENFSGTNKGSQLHFSTTLNGSASMTPGMTLDHNGYLGIGTMGPASKLHIHDAGTSALSISTNTNLGIGNDVELIFKSDLDGTPNPATIGQYNDGALRFSGQANLVNPDMAIADDGMIGIGTTVPLSKIHVYGTFDPIQIMVENTGGAFKTGYRLKTGTGEWFMGQVNPSTFSIKDITANKVRVEIDALGNVGIGTTAPVELLDVAGRLRIAPLAAPGATAEKLYNVGGNLFWDGVQLNSGSSGWSLLGNAGTVDVTNFIGTTDDVPFNFRVNGIESGRIESDNGTNTGGNTFLGYYAGSSNAVNVGLNEGLYNTAVGNAALWSNTIGYGNNAFGSYALNSNISGNGNLAIGGSALFSNLSGNDNIAVGSGALYSNIASAGNIAIGNNALFNNKMGNNATAVGTNAMQYANDQVVGFENNNVALGYEALRGSLTPSDNTGNNNTALGYQTLLNNTSGVYNTAIGNMTLRSNTTGASNTSSGYRALYSNTDGYSNTASGVNALELNTRGFWNIAMGEEALKNNSTASRNVAIGNQALYSQSFSNGAVPWNSNNVAVGSRALYFNQPNDVTTGIQNTAVGTEAMYFNTSGRFNTALGFRALYNFNDPAKGDNTALGNEALYNNLSGGANTATGDFALHGNTTGDWNTATGTFAGDFITTGSGNTFIGYDADATSNSINRSVAIGYNAKVDASNSLILGGTGVDAVNVGIGTTLPLATLDITWDGGTVLFPRKSTGGDPAGAANGMIYYNQNANKFRGYENGVWKDMVVAVSPSWALSGNAGTVDDGTNFIGTTDDIPFNIRVNNFKAGRVESDSWVGNNFGNTFLGYQSGNSSTTGWDNTGSGMQALYSNTTGTDNTASGYGALYSNTIGDFNTASGTYALFSSIDGNENTAFGSRALQFITSGSKNTALGNYALYNNTTGSNATAIGWGAMLYANNTAIPFDNYNVAVGYEALRGSVTPADNFGNFNTALGYQTLINFTSGGSNSAVGYRALFSNTTGTDNTASGWGALASNSTANYNSAFGVQALYLNTIGAENTAIGYQSLSNNTTGSQNTAVGWGSLYTQSFNNGGAAWGANNTAIGYEALYSNQPVSTATGVYNTAIGNKSLRTNTTGYQNTAIGYTALISNISGYNNVAIGHQALYFATGNENTAIGTAALNNNTGSNNTALGYQAGYNSTGAASNNVFIGNYAGYSETGSNKLYIANSSTASPLIYGDFTASQLDINGQIKITGGTPGAGQVLTSDASGLATWEDPAGGTSWALLGNASTVDGTNFIGTTDDTPINFKINGSEAGRIESTSLAGNNFANTFMGFQSGEGNTIGSYNTFLGSLSGATNITGSSNTFIGYQAGYSNLAGFNSFFGRQAGSNNSTGNSNSFFGSYSGFNSNGSNNSFFGYGSGNNVNTGAGNTAIGSLAGGSNLTSGDNNTLIGTGADLASATQRTNATAIGYNAKVDADNALILGGTGADAVNVGLGTTSPSAKLDIAPATSAAINIQPYGGGAGQTGELRFFETIANAEYVGFKAPDFIVANRIWTLPANDGGSGNFLKTDGAGNLNWGALPGGANAWITSGSSINNNNTLYTNVAINTTGAAPAAEKMLEITQPSIVANSVGIYSAHTGAVAGGTGYAFQAVKTGVSNTNVGGYFSASGATNNYALIVPSTGGNVGIGTTGPRGILEIFTSAPGWNNPVVFGGGGVELPMWMARYDNQDGAVENTDGLFIGQGTAAGTNTLFGVSANGNVGIGTTSPGVALDVVNLTYPNAPTIRSQGAGNPAVNITRTNGTGGTLDLAITDGSPAWFTGGITSGDAIIKYGAGKSLKIGNNGGAPPLVTIDASGNVGIGETAPTNKLQVFSNDASIRYGGQFLNSATSGPGNVVGAVFGASDGASAAAITKYGGLFQAAYGAGTNYGVWGEAFGGTGTNIGGYFNAVSGVNNYAIIVPSGGGNVGIGTTAPSYKLHSTTAIQGDRAIYGENTNSGTGVNNYGVYGYSVAAAPGYGYGGYFEGNFRGVHAVANSVSATQNSHAVFADNIGVTTSGSKIGVSGRSIGASTGRNTGVYGEASGSTGDNYGGYFKGNVNVDNFINYSKGTIVLGVPNGANNDVDINSTLAQQHTYYTTGNATGAFSISGFTGGIDGRMLIVHNTSGNNMTITNLGASGASNQIMTNGAAAVTTGQGTATFIYDLTLAKWILISFSP